MFTIFNRAAVLVVLLFCFTVVGFAAAQEVTDVPTVEAFTPAPTETATDTATPTPSPEVTAEPTPIPTPDPNPLPDEPPVVTPGDILERLFDVLKGTYIAWAAAGTLVIVALIKMVAFRLLGVSINGTAAGIWAIAVQVVIWILYNVAQYFGMAEQFQNGFLAVVEVLKSLLPFVGGLFLTHGGYKAAHKYDVPLVGYKPPSTPKSNMIRG